MDKMLSIRLSCAQRLAASDLLPDLSDRFMLDSRNERTVQLTPKQLVNLHDAATRSKQDAPDGMARNTLRHIIEKTMDVLTVESSTQDIIKLKITLVGSDPPIWRRVEMSDCSLAHLHNIIQVAMGWEDYHLHRFEIGQRHYGIPHPTDRDMGIKVIDERKVQLSDVIAGAGKRVKFVYEYDFGDGWQHAIKLEGTGTAESGAKYPRCTAGERACPPEDVGGVWGYEEFLEAISDPEHERHEELIEWIGDFDPEEFSLDAVNQELRDFS